MNRKAGPLEKGTNSSSTETDPETPTVCSLESHKSSLSPTMRTSSLCDFSHQEVALHLALCTTTLHNLDTHNSAQFHKETLLLPISAKLYMLFTSPSPPTPNSRRPAYTTHIHVETTPRKLHSNVHPHPFGLRHNTISLLWTSH